MSLFVDFNFYFPNSAKDEKCLIISFSFFRLSKNWAGKQTENLANELIHASARVLEKYHVIKESHKKFFHKRHRRNSFKLSSGFLSRYRMFLRREMSRLEPMYTAMAIN